MLAVAREVAFLAALLLSAARATPASFRPEAATAPAVSCERFGDPSNRTLILLHGASGPGPFYREQAAFFANHGYRVLLPHYLEAGRGTHATDENYAAWIAAIRRVFDDAGKTKIQPSATVIVGYSLGASISLALGSQDQGPDAIAEFSGSLPDRYYRALKGMPPLLILHGALDKEIPVSQALQLTRLCMEGDLPCNTHIYPADGHALTPESLRDADQRVLEFFSKVVGAGSTSE